MASEKDCLEALNEHEELLFDKKNVVGLGITAVDEENPVDEDVAVAVYVVKKQPAEGLNDNDLIPDFLELTSGEETRQVPVRIIEQGEVWLEASSSESFSEEEG